MPVQKAEPTRSAGVLTRSGSAVIGRAAAGHSRAPMWPRLSMHREASGPQSITLAAKLETPITVHEDALPNARRCLLTVHLRLACQPAPGRYDGPCRMTIRHTRILGAILLIGALLALWIFLPALFPSRVSRSGFAIVKEAVLTRMALSYLLAGLAAGFGLALLLWPMARLKTSPPADVPSRSPRPTA